MLYSVYIVNHNYYSRPYFSCTFFIFTIIRLIRISAKNYLIQLNILKIRLRGLIQTSLQLTAYLV